MIDFLFPALYSQKCVLWECAYDHGHKLKILSAKPRAPLHFFFIILSSCTTQCLDQVDIVESGVEHCDGNQKAPFCWWVGFLKSRTVSRALWTELFGSIRVAKWLSFVHCSVCVHGEWRVIFLPKKNFCVYMDGPVKGMETSQGWKTL